MVRDRLADSPFAAEPRARVVLTGGASQLTGIPDLASRILGREVRIGRPLGFGRLPNEAKSASFAVPPASWSIRNSHILNTLNRGIRGRSWTGTNGYLKGRTMASRGLLMISTPDRTNPSTALACSPSPRARVIERQP